VTDDTATRIGAGMGAVAGFVVGGMAGLVGSHWITRDEEGRGAIGALGAVIGTAVGAYLGVPSGTCLSPEKATVGTSGPPMLRFP
jgi:uncharacterized membrane protein YeaQ/YmgE (transglycosylase-associated protein family)